MKYFWRKLGSGMAIVPAAALLASAPASGGPVGEARAASPTTLSPTPSGAARRLHPEVRERLVLAFGDSLYAGYGLRSASQALPAGIESRLKHDGLNARVVNAGVSGESTAGGRRRFVATLDGLGRKPDLVMIGLGANDLWQGISPAQTRANLVFMLDECRRRGIAVVMTGMRVPTFIAPQFTQAYNAIWPDLAKRYGVDLDPFILAGVFGDEALMQDDGVHPNARGVDRMADRIAPIVARRLRKLPA